MSEEDRRRFREVGARRKLRENILRTTPSGLANVLHPPLGSGICGICWLNPIDPDAYHVLWCAECLAMIEEADEMLDEFIMRRRYEVAFELQIRLACTGCYPQDNLTPRELCTCSCHVYARIQAKIKRRQREDERKARAADREQIDY